MESLVFLGKIQWFALRTAEHTAPEAVVWAVIGGLLALQICVKSDHLATAWAFSIEATAKRAERVALLWGQSDLTSTCLANFS